MTDAEAALTAWLTGEGLAGAGLAPLLDGFASRIAAAGVPLSRAYLALPSISPTIRAESLGWRPGTAILRDEVEHDRFPDAFMSSPIRSMIDSGTMRRRWRLDTAEGCEGYPLLHEFRADGLTDYAAQVVRFGGGATTALQGVAFTACTDRVGGFSDGDLGLLDRLAPLLALAAYRITLTEVATTVLAAYVGRDAGARILSGEIRPGQGHRRGVAILFADLSGFTARVDRGAEGLIERLGRHLAAMAESVEEAGGEVLKFMGDGLLAGFPVQDSDEPTTACAAALAAARNALLRNAAVNARYPDEPRLDLDVALHRGEVFYGNVGGGTRLDFTVIGPAVNEASRIERLCGDLAEPLLMSAEFALCCGAPVRSLGLHGLRGVAERREIFAPGT